MIEAPRRSVTRFFIPMIDVLTLLFCIFLLMPMVKPGETEEGEAGSSRSAAGAFASLSAEELARQQKELERMKAELQKELDRLGREKIDTLQERLAVVVLHISGKDGKLFFHDPEPVELVNETAAHALIRQQREKHPGRELYFLLLFPREESGFPEQRQIKEYRGWFKGVALGIDNPRAS